MTCIQIQIVRFVEEHQPNIVEGCLIEASGRVRTFIEKAAIFTADYLDAESVYPQPGAIACEIVSAGQDSAGRAIVTVDTLKPWGIEDIDGETRFVVLQEQIVEC